MNKRQRKKRIKKLLAKPGGLAVLFKEISRSADGSAFIRAKLKEGNFIRRVLDVEYDVNAPIEEIPHKVWEGP